MPLADRFMRVGHALLCVPGGPKGGEERSH